MTHPLPAEAVEAAVRLAVQATARPSITCLNHDEYAEQIILAAYPAIREAVVGEFKGLMETWRSTALADHEAFGKIQDSTARLIVAKADQRLSCADHLAALI